MWKKLAAISAMSVLVVSLGGCASDGGNKRTIGTIGGAVVGGVIGSQIGGGTGKTIAIIAGSAIGAYLGSEIGGYMDRQDQVKTQQAIATTPTHHTAHWTNQDNGANFKVTPNDDIYYDSNLKKYCRNFTQTVTVDDKIHSVNGKACAPQKSGPWEIISAKS